MRFAVTGGRDFSDSTMVAGALAEIPGDAILIHGGAAGADNLCASGWSEAGGRTEPHLAKWDRPCDSGCTHEPRTRQNGQRYCPAAGVLRNQEMVDSGLDLLIVFPGGRGTADMVRRAQEAGIPVRFAK